MSIKSINVPIYRCSVIFLVDASREEYESWRTNYKDCITEKDNLAVLEEFDLDSLGVVIHTEGNDYICKIDESDNCGLVAHEIFHAADAILKDRGHKAEGIDEPTAYLIEYLTDEFYKK